MALGIIGVLLGFITVLVGWFAGRAAVLSTVEERMKSGEITIGNCRYQVTAVEFLRPPGKVA
jgi:hypothetical protein